MAPKTIAFSALLDLFRPSLRVFLHAGPAESLALRAALRADPDRAKGIEFFGIFIPGVNDFDYASLHDEARASSSFVPPSARKSFETGRFDFAPVHYSELGPYVRSRPIDIAVLHCPPQSAGAFSLGVNADVAAAAARHAGQCAVIINPALPFTNMADPLPVSQATYVVEGEGPLLSNPSEAADETSDQIADRVAALVQDGDTIQIGIGRLPATILRKLGHHRRLKMHTGMITDEVANLVRLGAMDKGVKTPIKTGMAIGSEAVRDLSRETLCCFYATDVTHDIRQIAAIDSFVSINSAVEVDLFGQVNGELINGRQMSGVGGSSDFTRAARLSRNGRAIIALPASARGKSRIVLQTAGPATQSRSDADCVVTEYGVAHLRNRTIDARAEALIAVAAPAHREALAQAWRERRASL
ncbi:MAG: acetyl-CoA hydrolase/transferase family protein [Beijerinckiaceae bacterium]